MNTQILAGDLIANRFFEPQFKDQGSIRVRALTPGVSGQFCFLWVVLVYLVQMLPGTEFLLPIVRGLLDLNGDSASYVTSEFIYRDKLRELLPSIGSSYVKRCCQLVLAEDIKYEDYVKFLVRNHMLSDGLSYGILPVLNYFNGTNVVPMNNAHAVIYGVSIGLASDCSGMNVLRRVYGICPELEEVYNYLKSHSPLSDLSFDSMVYANSKLGDSFVVARPYTHQGVNGFSLPSSWDSDSQKLMTYFCVRESCWKLEKFVVCGNISEKLVFAVRDTTAVENSLSDTIHIENDSVLCEERKKGYSFKVEKGRIVDYGLNFVYGPDALNKLSTLHPDFDEVIKSIPMNRRTRYGHPFLRTVVDYFTALALTRIGDFSDCGSKWHKLLHLLPLRDKKFTSYRPRIFAYDHLYWTKHEKLLKQNSDVVTAREEKWSSSTLFDSNHDLLCVDAIYYPGVKEAITRHLLLNPSKKAVVVFTAYSQKPGYYRYVDNEGFYTIYRSSDSRLWVSNTPNENGTTYRHPLFKYDNRSTMDHLDSFGIFWNEICSVDVGGDARIVMCELRSLPQFGSMDVEQVAPKDDMLVRSYYTQQLYSASMKYWVGQKIKTLDLEKIRSGINFVCNEVKLSDNGLTTVVLHSIRQNLIYAALDYLKEFKQAASELSTLLGEPQISFFARIRAGYARTMHWVSLLTLWSKVTLLLEVTLPVLLSICALILLSWFYAVHPSGKEFFPLVGWAVSFASLGGFCFYLFYVFLYPRFKNTLIRVRVDDVTRYDLYKDVQPSIDILVKGADVKWLQLSEKQRKEMLTHNSNLKLDQPLSEILEKALRLERESPDGTKFYHSGFEFEGELTAPKIMKTSPLGSLYAIIARQCGHNHTFDNKVLAEFREFSDRFIPNLAERFKYSCMDTITFEEYLKKVPAAKRSAYRAGYEMFLERGKIQSTFEVVQKRNEQQFAKDEKVKPRCIFNPSFASKALGTYINNFLIKCLPDFLPEVCVGYNTGDLCRKLESDWVSLKQPVVVTWDGSNHDAHQYKELVEVVDNVFLKNVLGHIISKTDLPFWAYGPIMKNLTATQAKFYLPWKKQVVCTGTVSGTVFSGHSVRTTFGNSLRVVSYVRFIMERAGIPESCYRLNVAGDDVMLFLEEEHLKNFKAAFNRVYIDGNKFDMKDEVSHGLGQVAKDFKVSDNELDFLSKWGKMIGGRCYLNRRIERALISGNYTDKIRETKRDSFSIANFNYAITCCLESWGIHWPVIREYIRERKRMLVHNFTQVSSFLGTILDVFSFTKVKNDYCYEQQELFFHMYDTYGLSLAMDNVHQAPMFFSRLYRPGVENGKE